MKFGDTLCDAIYSPTGMFGSIMGIIPDYLEQFKYLVNYVNSADTFSDDFAGLESLMRTYFRHLNSLNLLSSHMHIPKENTQNSIQDISRVSFEISIYLYYILTPKSVDEIKRRSNAYEASAYQSVAKFFQHFSDTSFAQDLRYISEIKKKVDIQNYLESSRSHFMQCLPNALFKSHSPHPVKNDWLVTSDFWISNIDNHKWYDNGTQWSSFYLLVKGLSKFDTKLMDYYYLVYQPACASVHSHYSSNCLDLNFTGDYPSVTSSDQDASSMWFIYFVRMLVWYGYKLSVLDSRLSSVFGKLQALFNQLPNSVGRGMIIDNNGHFVDALTQNEDGKGVK